MTAQQSNFVTLGLIAYALLVGGTLSYAGISAIPDSARTPQTVTLDRGARGTTAAFPFAHFETDQVGTTVEAPGVNISVPPKD
jgi:hypothetical protein